MKFLRSTLGYMFAGMLVMTVWGWLAGNYGMPGGLLGALIIIGPMWFMNHYVGLIHHDDDSAWVDMALGIAVTGVMRDIFSFWLIGGASAAGELFIDTLPTLGLVILGGLIGGVTAGLIEKDLAKDAEEKAYEESAA